MTTVLEIRLLGPVEVSDGGPPIALRPRERALVALLALRPGEPVSTDALVDALWGATPPKTVAAALHNAVSHVRKALGAALVTRAPGYALEVEPVRIDAHRFVELVAEARATTTPADRARLLRAALELWRGRALADLVDEPFAAVEAARLDEARLAAREDLVEAGIALGRHVEVVGEADALVAEHPFSERARALQMIALYRAGRQVEALDAFRAARTFLRDELGLEPGPALRKVEAAILRQDPALDPPAAGPALPAVERRTTLSVVFADIVDSTGLAGELDPEAYGMVLSRWYRVARGVLEMHGGAVEKFIGDAVVGVFGAPRRHEDDAVRAVRAAVELGERLEVLNDELESSHGVRLAIRTAVNTGETVAGGLEAHGSFAVGYVASVAAKLQQAAAPGEVVLGPATYALVRDAVRVEAAPSVELGRRGTGLIPYRVRSLDRRAAGLTRRLDTPLVGRENELAVLRAAFAGAVAERRPRLITVLGEAGIGKSRLAAELTRSVRDQAAVAVGRCVSYGEGATYLPLAEVVAQLAGGRSEPRVMALLRDADDASSVARPVRQLLGWAEGTPPPGEGFRAIRRLLEARAAQGPLLVVLDDVQWAEPTLLDLLEHVVERAADVPLAVLCLARPDFRESRPAWPVTVVLGPLREDAAGALASSVHAGHELPPGLRRRVIEIAEGNALYIEQLVAHAAELGAEALDATPPSLESLLASRLDVLPERERSVLERAAVVGREFAKPALDHLSGADVGRELDALTGRGLVRPADAGEPGEEGHRFHHVLIRDVAYAAITKARRATLHERVASWLDANGAGGNEIIGYHLEQAYRSRVELRPDDDDAPRLAREAGERLGAAGLEAWKRADGPAAVNLLGRAADLLPPSERRAEVLCERASALWSVGDNAARKTALEEAIDVATGVGSRRTELWARVELAQAGLYGAGGLHATADDVLAAAAQAIPALEELGDDRALGRTWLAIAEVHSMRLDNHARGEAAARAVHHYRRTGFSLSMGLTIQAASHYYGATPVDDGLRLCAQLVDEAAGDRHARASVIVYAAGLHAMRGDFDEARRLTDEASAIFDDLGASFGIDGPLTGLRAAIERLAGDLDATEARLRESRDALERTGELAFAATRSAQLADVLLDLGRDDEAEHFAELARSGSNADDLITEVYWRSARARLLARRGARRDAESLAREAVDLIAGTDALNQRAKATLDLAAVVRSWRPEEFAALVRGAVDLYRRKGNEVALRAAESLLEEGSPAGAARRRRESPRPGSL